MATKRVIYLPATTALPPGVKLLTEEEAQKKYNKKSECVELPVPPKEAEDSQVFGTLTITTLGDTEVWDFMQRNVCMGLDFGLDDDKPVIMERQPCGAWQQITDSIKLRK